MRIRGRRRHMLVDHGQGWWAAPEGRGATGGHWGAQAVPGACRAYGRERQGATQLA